MAFDYTKKANYHYVDLGDIDESMLNHPLYPNRTGKEKNALYFVDKAFLYEALASRFIPYKGVTVNGNILHPAQFKDLSTLAISHDLLSFENSLLPSLPSTAIYSSISEAVDAEITTKYLSLEGFSNVASFYSATNGLTIYLAHYLYAQRDRWLDGEKISAIYTALQSIKDNIYVYYSYSTATENVPTPSYKTVIEKSNENFSITNYLIAYKKRESVTGSFRQSYDGEGYTIQKNNLYTFEIPEKLKNCVKLRYFVLAAFADLVANATKYTFVELPSNNGQAASEVLLSRGKTICPASSSSELITSQSFVVYTNFHYVFFEPLVDISI